MYGREQHHYLLSLRHKTWPLTCVIYTTVNRKTKGMLY
jgi:hypothetical protein